MYQFGFNLTGGVSGLSSDPLHTARCDPAETEKEIV
jgi:hypothetical protein